MRKRLSSIEYLNSMYAIKYLLVGFLFGILVIQPSMELQASHYPDQQYMLEGADSLLYEAEQLTNIVALSENEGIGLIDSGTSGSIIFRTQSSAEPFNRALPSWNGKAPGDDGGFRVFIRVPYNSGWSPWLEVGYWKDNLWSGGKSTSYGDGRIAIDTGIFYSYHTQWQFKIEMKRNDLATPSPEIHLLSMTVSDSRTTDEADYFSILNDDPEPIYVDTDHIFQYSVDDEIGGRICSPTSASMVLLSYGIDVDPYQFALDNRDPYYDIFGVWPRTVQNASEYGLKGTVNRYRTWSETREILNNGGRIVMSVGLPISSAGHLIMLAGFDEDGDPIVHDPGRSDGYAYQHSKYSLSHSWFDKGGVAYTFYLEDSSAVGIQPEDDQTQASVIPEYLTVRNYPNPFNASTTFQYDITVPGEVTIQIVDLSGKEVSRFSTSYSETGSYRHRWDGLNSAGQVVPSGQYFYRITLNNHYVSTGKLTLLR